MNDHLKPTLVILLFPQFETPELREGFMAALKEALVVTEAEIRVLEYLQRYDSPLFVKAYLKDQAEKWGEGQMALICFMRDQDLLTATSKIGTYDLMAPGIRPARKVLVTTADALDAPYVLGQYPSTDGDGQTTNRLLLMVRMSEEYSLSVKRELASYIGTRVARRKDTQTLLAVAAPPRDDEPTARQGLPITATRKRRDDEPTSVGFPVEEPGTGKVVGLRPSNPDGVSGDDDRPTIEPPPPAIPFQPKR
jgi:hypothetical protein